MCRLILPIRSFSTSLARRSAESDVIFTPRILTELANGVQQVCRRTYETPLARILRDRLCYVLILWPADFQFEHCEHEPDPDRFCCRHAGLRNGRGIECFRNLRRGGRRKSLSVERTAKPARDAYKCGGQYGLEYGSGYRGGAG